MTVQPGGFRVRSDPNPRFRVALEVAYTEDANADAIRKELNEVHYLAVKELDKRFTRDNRRRPPAANQ